MSKDKTDEKPLSQDHASAEAQSETHSAHALPDKGGMDSEVKAGAVSAKADEAPIVLADAAQMQSDTDDEIEDETQAGFYDLDEAEIDSKSEISWKRYDFSLNRKLTPLRTLILLGVLFFIPWYLWGERLDIAYFFSSSEAIDLGQSADYIKFGEGIASKPQDFDDNRYVEVSGIPIRHVAIRAKDNPFLPKVDKLVYQLMGSSLYVEEPLEDSKFAEFMASTTSQFSEDMGVSPIGIRGRLRRFDVAEAPQYSSLRDYYSSKYGTVFCQEMSRAERERKARLLGKGGVVLSISPDNEVSEGYSTTHATLIDVVALSGHSAMALGRGNLVLKTQDAGMTWHQIDVDLPKPARTMTYDATRSSVFLGGLGGWVGGSQAKDFAPSSLGLGQDVNALAFAPMGSSETAPKLLAVGKEALLAAAYAHREGWVSAPIDEGTRFNATLRLDKRLYVAGSDGGLMTADLTALDRLAWHRYVSPVKADWLGLMALRDWVVATGSDGQVIRHKRGGDAPIEWELWPVDDVPGIDFDVSLRASAVTPDEQIWVGVGTNGAIVRAERDADGKFGRIRRLSASYIAYGYLDDVLSGQSLLDALSSSLARYSENDFNDISYSNGLFWAVGGAGLLMTSPDGRAWQKRALPLRDKSLRAIAFVSDKLGYIGGERGTLMTTVDGGERWTLVKLSTDRSINALQVVDKLKGIVYAGAYGLWGYCYTEDNRCFTRSRTLEDHINALSILDKAPAMNQLKVLLAGNNAQLYAIDDAQADERRKTVEVWKAPTLSADDIVISSESLPLRFGSARGHLALISSGAGTVYRSLDAGFSFKRESTGADSAFVQFIANKNGEEVFALTANGDVYRDLYGLGQWRAVAFKDTDKVRALASRASKHYAFSDRCAYWLDSEAEEQDAFVCYELGERRVLASAISKDGPVLLVFDEGSGRAERLLLDEETGKVTRLGEGLNLEKTASLRFVSCADELYLSAIGTHTIYGMDASGKESVTEMGGSLLDLRCLPGAVMALVKRQKSDGIWAVWAQQVRAGSWSELWSANLGFEPRSSQLSLSQDGRWLWANVDPASDELQIMMSRDGQTWSWRRDRLTDFYGLARAADYAVAVGDSGRILTSQDGGSHWAEARASARRSLRDVCLSADGRFGIAVGDGGTILRAHAGFMRWTRLNFKLDIDLTSCVVVERPDDFRVYIAGKGGAIYVANDRQLSRFDLVASPSLEDINALTVLETGEVLAVGGQYQEPESICEEGFIIVDGLKPRDLWPGMLFKLFLFLLWVFSLRALLLGIRASGSGRSSFNV